MQRAIQADRYEEAAKMAEALIAKGFVNLEAHFTCFRAYRALNNLQAAQFHERVFLALIRSILGSGDGKTKETAFVAVTVSEEHHIMAILGLSPLRQSLIDDKVNSHHYDCLEGKNQKTGETLKVYFNVDAAFGKAGAEKELRHLASAGATLPPVVGPSGPEPLVRPSSPGMETLVSRGFSFGDQPRKMCSINGPDGPCRVEAFVGPESSQDQAGYTCSKLDRAGYIGHCVNGALRGVSVVIADGAAKTSAEAFISYFDSGRMAYPALKAYLDVKLPLIGVAEKTSSYGCVVFGKWDNSAKMPACRKFAEIYGGDIFTESTLLGLRDHSFNLSHYGDKLLKYLEDKRVLHTVVSFTYSGGSFTSVGDKWIERGAAEFHFTERSRDGDYIYLLDQSRGMELRLPFAGGWCGWRVNGGSWNALYSVTPHYASESPARGAPAPPPQLEGDPRPAEVRPCRRHPLSTESVRD